MFARCVIIFVLLFDFVKCAKILVVSPVVSGSHQLVFRTLIQELVNRNHEVTAITIESVYPQGEFSNNLREINIKNLTWTLWSNRSKELAKPTQSNLIKMKEVYRDLAEVFVGQINEESIRNLITDKTVTFDLLIVPNVIPASLIFSHIFKAPVIFMSPFGALPGNMKMIGSETHPLLYPTHYQQKMYNLTFWEKIYELYNDKQYNDLHEKQELEDDKMLKTFFGVDIPTLAELKDNVHMLLLSVHPIWIHNQPVPLSVFYFWGNHKRPEKMLPEDLQSYLDSSKHGVIYVSFGSLIRTSQISPETLNIFLKVFSRLPYDILWKWDSDELPGKSDNIKISKWFPQCDVLRHQNLKLFITHAGLGSTAEAINAGVPLIGIPQFSDQGNNAQKYLYFKIGLKLEYSSLTIENLESAINTIFTNYDSYKRNIIQLRTLMNDQPMPVLEQVMWRIEHILRHNGTRHLRSPAANLSWPEYYELALVLLFLTGLVGILSVLLVTLFTCLRYSLSLINFNNEIKQTKELRYRS